MTYVYTSKHFIATSFLLLLFDCIEATPINVYKPPQCYRHFIDANVAH
jgi:hypothetical protein